MHNKAQIQLRTLGLFEQRMAGDDCLMKLASRRFLEAAMGAEMHASTLEQLEWLMSFRPSLQLPVALHLPRHFNMIDPHAQQQICAFASRFAGRIFGMVLHDDQALVTRKHEYLEAARHLNSELRKIAGSPVVFVEYAAGLEPGDFLGFFSKTTGLSHISACIDIGHVGIRAAGQAFVKSQGGRDIFGLKDQNSSLPPLMPAIDTAVASGVRVVLDLVRSVCALGKPVHFHLHDGHPLSRFSPFGVADHLSFLAQIPLNFEYRGRNWVPTMFGPSGLAEVVACALSSGRAAEISFTLEIHPTGERLSLGDAAPLFAHWTDKTNAEQMNHWLSLLNRNHSLLLEAIQAASQS